MMERGSELLSFEGNPFETFFQNEFFDRQYRFKKQLNTAVGFFALVAILIAALVLALGAVSIQTLRAANSNPTNSLKYE